MTTEIKEFPFANTVDDPYYYKYDQYGRNPMRACAPAGIIALKSAIDFSQTVNEFLVRRRQEYMHTERETIVTPGFLRDDYHIPINTVRFSSGEGKGIVERTVRGHDLYILVDPTNYSVTYNMRGIENHMSPDDHYQDLKRIILAISGKAHRINVFMPYLYEGRQHRRNARESLDCAYMLEELASLGVENFITFDAHDDRVANAVPTFGFESVPAVYQILKALNRTYPELLKKRENLMIVSPDEGGIHRAMYYASILGVPLGTFYKRRDYTKIKGGRNPIIAHEFLGDDVGGRDVIIVDDMISSGDSMIDLAESLKSRNANRVICVTTFGLFTNGLDVFNRAYEEGFIDKVFCTNLIYRSPEILQAPWYVDVNMAKFVALLIDAINHNASLAGLVDPSIKIANLLDR